MVVIVTGPSGSGKTTVGGLLARELGWPFDDGDDFHTPESVAKMAAGVPLTEADRAPWVDRLRARVAERLSRGEDAVLACSALRAQHRERLAVDPARVRFVYLKASPALLATRLALRPGHFAGPALLPSQLATLEEPTEVLVVDASASPAALVATIRAALGR